MAFRKCGAERRGPSGRKVEDVDLEFSTNGSLVQLTARGEKRVQFFTMNLPTWLMLSPLIKGEISYAVCYEHTAAVLDGEFSGRNVKVMRVNTNPSEPVTAHCHCGEKAFFYLMEIQGTLEGHEPISWISRWHQG